MNQRRRKLKLVVLIVIMTMIWIDVNAQQSRVDSVIVLLNKSKVKNGLDTVSFTAARRLILLSSLTDRQVGQIEQAALALKKEDDEDLVFLVKISIINSLSISDKYKAIEYAKFQLEKLENSKTPRAKLIYIHILSILRLPYRNSNRIQEGILFYTEKLNQLKLENNNGAIAACYYVLGGFYRNTGLYEPAIYNMKKSLSNLDTTQYFNSKPLLGLNSYVGRSFWFNNIAVLSDYYINIGDYNTSLAYSRIVLNELKKAPLNYEGRNNLLYSARHVVLAKLFLNQLDSIEYYFSIAEQSAVNPPQPSYKAYLLQYRAVYQVKLGNLERADSLLQVCWKLVNENNIQVNPAAGFIEPDYYLALVRIAQGKNKEAIDLLLKDIKRVENIRTSVLRDYKLLADLYAKEGDMVKSNSVYKSYITLQDSILTDQKKYQTISFEAEQKINENEKAISKLESENQISTLSRNFTIGIAALLLILAGSIYYRFRTKKKANQILEKTLEELKATQTSLIQSEKMASLGELTAGIAHEIQNPLNFVNNFSEVNGELLVEMKEELSSGNIQEAISLADSAIVNQQKIVHHGKRADAIVKGMLQHSRSSNGVKEPTNINDLADEYLRLAYHGLRAKDKSFNAIMKTDFDESIEPINIIPQDMGRVILNLITNAFYAVNEKSNQQITGYEPTVSVSTKKNNGKILISVKDNGNGIPQHIKDKIFQPFFTTKPTGQGTGLGLSLSYDIVKAHGGELIVDSAPDKGSLFIIQLNATTI